MAISVVKKVNIKLAKRRLAKGKKADKARARKARKLGYTF